jgi:predicted Rossmann fold nucleotide-binding protein DprA/Smf involved in DNA uptake
MEFGRELFGVPGNVTQAVNFAANLLIEQDAKAVTIAEDVTEELPRRSVRPRPSWKSPNSAASSSPPRLPAAPSRPTLFSVPTSSDD